MKKNNKGFTLVELIVVIAILGVLMAVLIPQYIQYVEKSRESMDLNTLGEALHAAEITAATEEEKPDSYTFTKSTDGTLVVPDELKSSLGKTIELKSSDGRDYAKLDQVINFDENGKLGWGSSCEPTDSAFSNLTDGKKGTKAESET